MQNILFLLIDCLRSDRCQRGQDKPLKTPFIDYLSQNGTSFNQAVSVASFTSPVVASILTGVYPFVHGIEWFSNNKLNPECTTLPEILKKAGYNTCAFVTGPLGPQLGLDRGFDNYLYRDEKETIYTGFKDRLENCLQTIEKPWFIFVHLWELHYPIYLPKHIKMRYSLSLNKYDVALSCLDHQLATLLEKIDLDETIVVLHGDHGERLPEPLESIQRDVLTFLSESLLSGWIRFLVFKKLFEYFPNLREKQGHGFHIYDILVRVPLIFAGNGFPKNKVIEKQVSQIDILPTLLDVVGLLGDFKTRVQGRSLMPLLNNEDIPERAVYLGPGGIRDGTRKETQGEWLEGLRTTKWKYVSAYNKDEPLELYDLENDPEEHNNLVGVRKEIIQRFQEELRKMKAGRPRTRLEMTQAEKEEMRKRLKALGYID